MQLHDRTYFIQRAVEERIAAEAASCEASRCRHLELAAAYEILSDDGLAILPVAPTRLVARRLREPTA